VIEALDKLKAQRKNPVLAGLLSGAVGFGVGFSVGDRRCVPVVIEQHDHHKKFVQTIFGPRPLHQFK
jgi:hypothetical protein